MCPFRAVRYTYVFGNDVSFGNDYVTATFNGRKRTSADLAWMFSTPVVSSSGFERRL
jgi:hypothetical protein